MSTKRTKRTDNPSIALDLDKLKKRRLKLGLTMDEAARLSGMASRHSWYIIESGKRSNITLATLDAVAKVLQVDPRWLLK